MSPSLKLYGVPLSQPFRSVAWALLQKQVRFDIVLTVPGLSNKMGTRHESFLQKSRGRTGEVPLLEIGSEPESSIFISQSPAILTHLCERFQWNDLYPQRNKTLIDSYLHWHHGGTRALSKLQIKAIRPDVDFELTKRDEDSVTAALQSLEHGWLNNNDNKKDDTTCNSSHDAGGFLCGSEFSIADLLAYEEFTQLTMTNLLTLGEEYPNISSWMKLMSELPYHQQVHVALEELGSLQEPDPTLPKRLSKATKTALQALSKVQESFPASSKL